MSIDDDDFRALTDKRVPERPTRRTHDFIFGESKSRAIELELDFIFRNHQPLKDVVDTSFAVYSCLFLISRGSKFDALSSFNAIEMCGFRVEELLAGRISDTQIIKPFIN